LIAARVRSLAPDKAALEFRELAMERQINQMQQ
jgi:hypothetical protein